MCFATIFSLINAAARLRNGNNKPTKYTDFKQIELTFLFSNCGKLAKNITKYDRRVSKNGPI